MRFSLYLIITVLCTVNLSAQSVTDSIYTAVETKPIFPGCESNIAKDQNQCSESTLYGWIFGRLMYPSQATKNKISDNPVLSFIVNIDGSISDPQIVKQNAPILGNEGIRILRTMQEEITWSPALIDSIPVRFRYIFPLRFQIAGAPKSKPIPKPIYMVFKDPEGQEVFKGMVSNYIKDKIPAKIIISSEVFDLQKSKEFYNVLDNVHILNFKANKLARPQELKSLTQVDMSEMSLGYVSTHYIQQAQIFQLGHEVLEEPTTFYIHNYTGDVFHQGQLDTSKNLENIKIKKARGGLLFISLVQDDHFATILMMKE